MCLPGLAWRLKTPPSGACGGQFNGTLSTLGYETQRVAGLHRRPRWTQASLAQRKAFLHAGRGCTFSKIFRSGACGGLFSIGQAAEWHNVTSDSRG